MWMLRYGVGGQETIPSIGVAYVYMYAKQKHLGCKKLQGHSEATLQQAGTTKNSDIS